MKKVLAAVLSIAIASAGCASTSGGRTPVPIPTVSDTSAMAEYVQKLPAGSRIRVDRTDGRSMKGTLMRATAQAITVQANTRVPEPPVEIPLNTVTRAQLEGNGGSSTARAVGIGIATGLGVFFGIIAVIAASGD
jgi:hypothetical protein